MPEHQADQPEATHLEHVSRALEREYRRRRRTLWLYLALLAVPVIVGVVAVGEGRDERRVTLETRAQVESIEQDYEAVSGQLERLDTLDAIIPDLATARQSLERQEAVVTSLAQGQDGLQRRISLQDARIEGFDEARATFEDTRAAFEDYQRRDSEWASGIQGDLTRTRRDVESFSRAVERMQEELETSGVREFRDELARQEALAAGLERSVQDIQRRLDGQERELRVLRSRQDSIRVADPLIRRLLSLEQRFERQDSTIRLFRLRQRDTLPNGR